MKIIFVNDKFLPDITGVGNYAYGLSLMLKKLGHEVIIITTIAKKEAAGVGYLDEIKVYRIYTKINRKLRNYFMIYNPEVISKIDKIFSQEMADVAHFFNVHSGISYYALKLSKKYNKVTFWHARDVLSFSYEKLTHFIYKQKNLDMPSSFNYKLDLLDLAKQARKSYNPLRNILIRHYLNFADRLFSVSQSLKDAMCANRIKQEIDVIYSGIDTNEFILSNLEINEFKEKYSLQNKKMLFLMGRLSPDKGVKQAVDSLAIVVKQFPETVLFLAAEITDYVKWIKNYAHAKGLGNNLVISGYLPRQEVIKGLLASDISLNPSLCLDAFPKVNLEAMAAAKPVVGTCFGGTPEVVIDGITGYIVNPLNVEVMAEKIIDLLKNPDKANKFGQAGYLKVKTEFNLRKKAEELLACYKLFLESANKKKYNNEV